MLESIVLLWIAVQLQAPLWVYLIVMLMLVTSALSSVLSLIDKIQERQLKREKCKYDISEEALAELKRWNEERERKEK